MTGIMNDVILGDSSQVLKSFPDECIDLTVTSPPYDDLRNYNGYSFDFETIAKELFRVTKDGGVVVWVIGDTVVKGSETGSSFKQVLSFMRIGFNLHDTMIYLKQGGSLPDKTRYYQSFEYMFVLSKGTPKTINLIKDRKNKTFGKLQQHHCRNKKTGEMEYYDKWKTPEFGKRFNVWSINEAYMAGTKDKNAYQHPAIFPEQIPKDHIISWSNEGDLVLDCFAGSGTTLKMAKLNSRNYIGIEISEKYCDIINKRLAKYNNQSSEVFTQ